ncbi:MAG: YggT family protein [Burkholderiales bacterium]
MNQALIFLVETFLGLLVLALLLRFILQIVRAPYGNPLSGFIFAITDFMVRPARRFIPGLRGYDLSSLLLAWVVEIALIGIVLSLKGYGFGPAIGNTMIALMLLAVVRLIRLFLYIVMFTVFIQAILSWVSPYSPAMPILQSLTRPFLRIFQQRIPPAGGVDLSPLFVLITCQLILMWPVASLEGMFSRMF